MFGRKPQPSIENVIFELQQLSEQMKLLNKQNDDKDREIHSLKNKLALNQEVGSNHKNNLHITKLETELRHAHLEIVSLTKKIHVLQEAGSLYLQELNKEKFKTNKSSSFNNIIVESITVQNQTLQEENKKLKELLFERDKEVQHLKNGLKNAISKISSTETFMKSINTYV